MAHHRVKKYECTVWRASTGQSETRQQEFTAIQAAEAGAILHSDGICLRSALKLCESWTRRGQHRDVRYSYRIRLCPQTPVGAP